MKGWQKVQFKDILEIRNGKNQKKVQSEDGEFPIYGSGGKMGNAIDFICPGNTTIIGRKGSINKPMFISEPFWNVDTAFGLIAGNKILPKYLFYFCKQYNFLKHNKATTLPSLTKSDLYKIKIPLPPLPEQKKIAQILDTADAYRQKTKALIEKYDALTQSLFLDMFGDPVTNPKGWEKVLIGDVVEEVRYGTSGKANLTHGEYPYLRMNNITYEGYMDYTNLKYIDVEEKQVYKYVTQKGDILFNRTNSKELVGKTGLILSDDPMIIAGYLIRVRLTKSYNPYYVWAHLNSKWCKLTLQNMCKSIVGMANINAKELQKITILDVPITLQNQFADRVEAIQKQKAKAQESLVKAEELFGRLMQDVFRGETGD